MKLFISDQKINCVSIEWGTGTKKSSHGWVFLIVVDVTVAQLGPPLWNHENPHPAAVSIGD
jgi:hypothetical protein